MKTFEAKLARRSLRLAAKVKHTTLPSKIIKNGKKHVTKFCTLNDYCIDEICEWLPLRSLAALGMTCTRLNRVTNSYFRRKHPANHVLMSSSNGAITLHPKRAYVECFSGNFRNIMIYGDNINVYEYTANKFKEIELFQRIGIFGAPNLTVMHVKCIDGIVKNAKVIELNRCSLTGPLYNTLERCSNMKFLVLKSIIECTHHGTQNDWLLQTYPQLEYLYWNQLDQQTALIPAQIKALFERNPNIKNLVASESILPFLQDNNLKLDKLILKVISGQNLELICNQLRQLIDKKLIKTVYMMGDLSRMNPVTMTNLSNVEGIYATDIPIANILQQLPHLKIIEKEITSMRAAIQLAKSLINVEEAYLSVKYIDFIEPFIRYSPKIRKIYIKDTASIKYATNLNLFKLNRLRKKAFSTAKNLTIYLKEMPYLKIKRMSIGYECDFVQIKLTETHVTDNPFVYTFLYS